MNPAVRLYNDTGGDESALETDVMRFMAIIGIIFWLLFALVRNTTSEEKPDASTHRSKQVSMVSQPKRVPATFTKKTTDRPKQIETETKPVDKIPRTVKKQVVEQSQHEQQGLLIEFQSIVDLYQLMTDGKVKVYCRIQSAGFDLVFETLLRNKALQFKSATRLPENLWEIQTGSERDHFMNRLLAAYPSVGAMAQRQVLVVFADPAMDRRIAGLVQQARSAGQDGTITINGQGAVQVTGVDLNGGKQ